MVGVDVVCVFGWVVVGGDDVCCFFGCVDLWSEDVFDVEVE